MKNVLCLFSACLFMLSNVIYGQQNFGPDFGVRIGGNLSTIWYSAGAHQCSEELFGIISSETFVPRYFIGAHSEFNVSDNMSVTLGVQYAFRGGGEDFTMPDPANSSERLNGTLDNRINYLQIPVQYHVKLNRFNIGLGGYWAYALSGEQLWKVESFDDQEIEMNFGDTAEDHMKKTDLGAIIEVGYRLTSSFQIFALYQRGLSSQISEANRETFKSLGYDWKTNHRAYGIGLTYFIPGKG